jgi:hypothetical protein
VHARNAWLKGLSPKENREVPPLRYDWAYRLKRERPALQRHTGYGGPRRRLLVVDNDPAASARKLVEGLRTHLQVFYVTEVERGLCSVRNRILAQARLLQADWLAGIDDDESAQPGWLEALWAARLALDADVLTGPVPRVPWGREALAEEIEQAIAQRADGHQPRRICCGNFLLRMAALGDPPLTFDPRLNFTGGEDHDFFQRLRERGIRAAWAARAVAVEWVPPERQGLAYRLRRHYTDGVSAVARARRAGSGPALWGRYGIKALGKLGGGLLALLALPLGPVRAIDTASARLANAAGLAAGLLGARAERYRRTDGC